MKTLILLLLAVPMISYAGQEVGNGGDLLVCTDSVGAKTFELYDLFEGRTRHKLTMVPPTASDPMTMVRELISRIDSINPTRANLYRMWLETFDGEVEYVNGGNLIDIPDTGDGYIPSSCELRQFAVQRTTSFPGEKRYLIDQSLWSNPAATNYVKASLILHELILREAINAPHDQRNSIGSRYINALIHAKDLPSDTMEWLRTLNVAGFRSGDYRHNVGRLQLVWEDGFHLSDTGEPMGQVLGGELNWNQIRGLFTPDLFGINIGSGGLSGWARLKQDIPFQCSVFGLRVRGKVGMLNFSDNNLFSAFFNGAGEILAGGRVLSFFGSDVQVASRDKYGPDCDHFLHHGVFTTKIQEKSVELQAACLKGNILRSFTASKDEILKDTRGKEVAVKAGATCAINSGEFVLSCDK